MNFSTFLVVYPNFQPSWTSNNDGSVLYGGNDDSCSGSHIIIQLTILGAAYPPPHITSNGMPNMTSQRSIHVYRVRLGHNITCTVHDCYLKCVRTGCE